jgi:hypothetical protein
VGPLKDRNGKAVQPDKEMADLLNRFYFGVFVGRYHQHPRSGTNWLSAGTERSEHICEGVKEQIRKLKVDGAAGPDGLGPLVLKTDGSDIRAASGDYENLPERRNGAEDWRTTNVTPIFKKGNKADPGNYRTGLPHNGLMIDGGDHQGPRCETPGAARPDKSNTARLYARKVLCYKSAHVFLRK